MKSLIELDSLYRETISKLDNKEHVTYCENLIDSLQMNLIKRRKYIKSTQIDLYVILSAAQQELKTLQKTSP